MQTYKELLEGFPGGIWSAAWSKAGGNKNKDPSYDDWMKSLEELSGKKRDALLKDSKTKNYMRTVKFSDKADVVKLLKKLDGIK